MPQVIVHANQKGGVGKTTTTINLAYGLARRGKKVALIDCDPQGSTTKWLGSSPDALNLYDLFHLIKRYPDKVAPAAVHDHLTDINGVLFLPSGGRLLEDAGAVFDRVPDNGLMLRKIVEAMPELDFIIVDTPPTLGFMLTVSIAAADFIVIPTKPQGVDFAGLAELRATIVLNSEKWNPNVRILGILITQLDGRATSYFNNIETIGSLFPGFLFSAMIPQNVAIDNSFRNRKAVIDDSPTSASGAEYLKYVDEVLDRIGVAGGH